jgi:hypothetical protein
MSRITLILIIISNHYGYTQVFSSKTNEVLLDFSVPPITSSMTQINWQFPVYEFSASQSKDIELSVIIEGSVSIKQIILQITDGNQGVREKKISPDPNTLKYALKQSLHLEDGQYTIKLICENVTGGTTASTRSILIGKDALADAVSIERKDYAILFATDKYDYWGDLVNPIYDASTIAQQLKDLYNFEVEVIENPTQEEVFIKLADYSQRSYRPQDQLFIFFAGHGYFDETFGEGFVVARNSLENDRAKTSYISHSRLRAIINNISCEHILLTMDVCFGGTFDPVVAKQRGNENILSNENDFLARKLSYKTRKYITSGGKTYVSDGIQGKHSPFAQLFLSALKNSGGSDRILTLGEIKIAIEKLIPEPRSGGFGDDNIASDFVFVSRQ